MKKKYSLIIFAVLVLTLSACERAYPTTPQAALPTQPADFPQPVATSGMNIIETAGTQTAIAASGLPVPTASGGESEPIVIAPTDTIDPNAPIVGTPLPAPTVDTSVVNTPVPQVVQPTVQTSKPGSYTLQQGEFPWCIARRFNVNPDELCALSGISCTQNYYTPGTVLRIPQTGNVFPGTRALIPHPAQYTVRSGDTIYSIACKFGDVDPANIPASSLVTGATIQIP